MKRHGNLYEKIYNYENLEMAFRKAAKGRRYAPAVLRFGARLDEHLIQLQNELIWRRYEPGKYMTFQVYRPKERTIYVAPFRDRVLQHAVMNIVEPIWERVFIGDSYACRKGKGTHQGLKRLDAFLFEAMRRWKGRVYCFKGDISKCFPSINHHTMMSIIKKKIKCPGTLWLFDKVIFSTGDRSDPGSCNLPIGNLISQWGANLYLNELDLYAKHVLGIKYYVRYMDDFIILHGDKSKLHRLKREVSKFLGSALQLKLNPKSDIFPIKRGIDFLGYRTWPSHRLLRKRNIVNTRRRFTRIAEQLAAGEVSIDYVLASLASWNGYCKHALSDKARVKCLEPLGDLIDHRYDYYR